MPRIARIVVPGAAHHVTQRGNNRQDVFFTDDDRRVYLELLLGQGSRHGFRVEGYCLMTNHVHVVGVPEREQSLALAIGRANMLYTQHINKLHGRSGHLWQNRFYSCALDEAHAMNALCYVELNPVRAGMVRNAWDYPWSSAAAHCGHDPDNLCLNLAAWREKMPPRDWMRTLRTVARETGTMEAVQRATHTGRPLGDDSFLSKLEHRLGRRLRPLPVGRPKGPHKTQGTPGNR
jgi:putative transposase